MVYWIAMQTMHAQMASSLPQICQQDAPKAAQSGNNHKKPSKIVYVKGFDLAKVSLVQLVNLAECFGDVENSLLHTLRDYALIKFSSSQGAKACIKELYGKEIGGKNLLIHYSELTDLVPKFYTNEKVYYTPKKKLKTPIENKGCHLSKNV